MHRLSRLSALLVTTTVLLAACSAAPGSGGTGDGSAGDGPSTGVGPGISIEDALGSTLDEPLLVNGALVAQQDGEVRLCSALAESFPPQCGGASLRVEGLDLSTVEGLTSANGVTWSEDQVQLLGRVENGVLTVDQTSLP